MELRFKRLHETIPNLVTPSSFLTKSSPCFPDWFGESIIIAPQGAPMHHFSMENKSREGGNTEGRVYSSSVAVHANHNVIDRQDGFPEPAGAPEVQSTLNIFS